MKKIFKTCLCFAMLTYCTKSTAQIDTSTTQKLLQYIFQPLEKNRVPNGLLLDYAMEFTNLSNFNGTVLTDSNMVMASEFWEIYNTSHLSLIHLTGLPFEQSSVINN